MSFIELSRCWMGVTEAACWMVLFSLVVYYIRFLRVFHKQWAAERLEDAQFRWRMKRHDYPRRHCVYRRGRLTD